MYKITWDKETGGIQLNIKVASNTLGVSPRPVFFEELDLLGLNNLGWTYPHCPEPLLWACNKQYFYRGSLVFEVKGANLYDPAIITISPGFENLSLKPVDMQKMIERNRDIMFLLESEAIEFIRETFFIYSTASKKFNEIKANQLDFEAIAASIEKKQKRKMAIIKEDCDSFDVMPLDVAESQGKQRLLTTKIDVFLASFSGGKDSQVVLDLCTRALPPNAFEVIYSDTGYELPSSLELYEEVKRHYTSLYPGLKFSIARNHASVLSYWDKIGTPSDTHRWCCSVMKTAPLYRSLKVPGTNKQAKVLAFEGTRGEESTKRSQYNRIGKGVKHYGVINARPIYNWNTTEIFLYLFFHNITINTAYRFGKPRVGCLICPFSSEWDDMIVNHIYPSELKPFVDKIIDWAQSRHIPNLNEFIKEHKWKIRPSGKNMKVENHIQFIPNRENLKGVLFSPTVSVETWLPTVGECVFNQKENAIYGELKYKGTIYSFSFLREKNNQWNFLFENIHDITLIGLIKRALYKTTYCIQCEACEVECPTGALSIVPLKIDALKCIHCHKCLTFHSKGCIVADSRAMADNDLKLTGISAYGTFGMREEWLSEFFSDPELFWSNNPLGVKQVPSFKAWLKDAEIINSNGTFSTLGTILKELYIDNPLLVWSIIWINLCYNSTLVKWFITHIKSGELYSKSLLKSLYEEEYSQGATTFSYSLDALYNTFATTPIGRDFMQKQDLSKTEAIRGKFEELSDEAALYSLYKFAQVKGLYSLRVTDLYEHADTCGIVAEFGISRSEFEKILRTLNSANNRLLVSELNMGLDHITLRDDLNPISILKTMI